MINRYIKVYDCILTHPELSRLEALLICEVMNWPEGCCKSSRELADLLRSDKRTIQRIIKSLHKRQWLAVLRESKNKRMIWATPKELPLEPLFEIYHERSIEAMTKHLK